MALPSEVLAALVVRNEARDALAMAEDLRAKWRSS